MEHIYIICSLKSQLQIMYILFIKILCSFRYKNGLLGGSEAQWTLNGFDVKTITTDRLHFVTRQYGDNHRLRIMNIDPSLSGEYAVRVSDFFEFFLSIKIDF